MKGTNKRVVWRWVQLCVALCDTACLIGTGEIEEGGYLTIISFRLEVRKDLNVAARKTGESKSSNCVRQASAPVIAPSSSLLVEATYPSAKRRRNVHPASGLGQIFSRRR